MLNEVRVPSAVKYLTSLWMGRKTPKKTKMLVFAKVKTVRLSPKKEHGRGTFTIVWSRGSAWMKFGCHVLDQSVPQKTKAASEGESGVVLNSLLWVPGP